MLVRMQLHGKRDGSLLIAAIIVVAVASAFAVAAGFAVRARARAAAERLRRRDGIRHAEMASVRAVFDRVASDTNAWDSLDEPWASEPWESREDGWVLRVSGSGWKQGVGKTTGMVDAERFAPLNDCPPEMIRELLVRAAGIDEAAAALSATAIVDWREERRAAFSNRVSSASQGASAATNAPPPFACAEELALVPSLAEGVADALRPLVTAQGSGLVNLNTAPITIIECLLASSDGGDIAAALRLRDRIAGFRDAGGVFVSTDPRLVSRALGGIPPDEAAVLARAAELVCVSSTEFHGIAEAQAAEDYRAGRAPFRRAFSWTRPAVSPDEVNKDAIP